MFEIKYRHYIRLNSQNEITHAFSDAFICPFKDDILLKETEERHCQFQVMSEKYIGKYKYKYIDGKIIEKSEDELYPIEEMKINKIKEIKLKAQENILSSYSIFQQTCLISNMHIKDTKIKQKEMYDFINNIRDILDTLEEQVNNCITKEDINNINIKF
jgi:hypothetical protein